MDFLDSRLSGKSSVVRAGLVPALRRGGVEGSSDWFLTTMVPGSHPFEALETALLRVATNPPTALLDQLRDGDRGIHRGVSRIVPDGETTVVVVIDQFEEMFTLTSDEERQRFLRALAVAVTEPAGPLRIVATMRADFYDQPLRHPEYAPLFKSTTVAITPLAPDELEEAISAPAVDTGMTFEPGLIAEIMADVNSQPGALPLLQYALTQTFDGTDGELMTADAYRGVGGLTGALARQADLLHDESDEPERHALQRLLGRMVTLGDGTEDTRHRVRRSELPADEATERVIDRFGSARLLTFDRDAATREPTVEIAHEALIREWPRLRGWLDDNRDELRIHRHVTETTAAWITAGRDEGELYRGSRLDAATTWAEAHDPDLNDDEREFLAASSAVHEAELSAERQRFEEQISANRRLRALAAAAAVIALIAAGAGVFALQQRSLADDRADEALTQARAAEAAEAQADLERLIAQARTASRADPTVGVLLALEAHRRSPSLETLGALHWALTARPGTAGSLESEPIGAIRVLDDGERFVTHTAETLDVWNAATRRRERSMPFPGADGADSLQLHVDVTGDGATAVATTPTGTSLVDLETNTVVAAIEHRTPPSAIELSPDDRRLVIGFGDGQVEVHRIAADLSLEARTEVSATVSDVAWHPDGNAVAIGSYDAGITMWAPGDGETLWSDSFVATECATFENATWGLLFSADGSRLVYSTQTPSDASCAGRASGERAILMVDSASGEELIERVADPYARTGIEWSSVDEREIIASPSARGPITVIDVGLDSEQHAPPRDVGELKTRVGLGLGVMHDLGVIAVAGPSGIELREIDGSGPLTERVPLAPAQLERLNRRIMLIGAFDGQNGFVTSMLAPGSEPYVTRIGVAGRSPTPFSATDGPSVAIVDGRSGQFTLHQTTDGFLIRDGVDGPAQGPVIPFPGGDPRRVSSVELNGAGDRLVVGQRPEWNGPGLTAVMYDVITGEVVAELEPPTPFTNSIVLNSQFTPSGTRVLVGDGFEHAEFDGRSGAFRSMRNDAGGSVLTDELLSVTNGPTDPIVRIIDANTLEASGEPLVGHESGIEWIEPNPTRPLVATQGREQTVRVWNLELRRQLGRPLPSEQAGTMLWSPDGTSLAVPGPDGYTVWNFDASTWPEIACQVAGRNMTRDEWDEFGPRTIEYRATCDQFPLEG